MKKTALSLLVVAASTSYVWHQAGGAVTGGLLAAVPPNNAAPTDSVGRRTPTSGLAASAAMPAMTPVLTDTPAEKADKAVASPPNPPTPVTAAQMPAEPAGLGETAPIPATPIEQVAAPVAIPVPRPRPLVTRAAMSFASSTAYADGTYTGPAVDAYYGYVQIQAIIAGGQLARIKVLQYPSDRRTSVFINRQALPMLRDEVVSAQTADVDIISGATLTSEAFIRSLDAALKKAGS